MNKRLFAIAAISVALASAASAQITAFFGNADEVRTFTNASGTNLAAGSLVRLGSFAAGTDFSTGSISYLDSQFTQYGSSTIGNGYAGLAGYMDASTTNAPVSAKLYYWVFNAPTTVAATQIGIFSNTGTLWTTPANAPDTVFTDLSTANLANFGTLTPSFAMTSAVPEPSTYAAILGLATLGFVGYRRYRRS